MAGEGRDGAAVRIPPPLVYLLAVVLGIVLQAFAWPLRLALAPPLRLGLPPGGPPAGHRAPAHPRPRLSPQPGRARKPGKTTPEIVSSGAYRLTRNPMYVAMALLQAAIGLAL